MFAGTQKNLGAAGLTIAVVRDDLLDHASKACPSILEYRSQSNNNSVFNTPPVYRSVSPFAFGMSGGRDRSRAFCEMITTELCGGLCVSRSLSVSGKPVTYRTAIIGPPNAMFWV